MNQSAILAVIGGDARQAYLAAMLRSDGHDIRTFALERRPLPDCYPISDLRIGLADVQAVILPLPVQHGEGQLNAPLTNSTYMLKDILDAIPADTLLLAGAVPHWMYSCANQNHLHLIDYLARDDLAIRNAVPTCEGALQLAMEHTEHTIQGTRCLVIGYGRIGSMLARKLQALDAKVTVSARSSRDFARIEAAGMRALDTRRLAGRLLPFHIIFNTVPAPVLGSAELSDIMLPCLVIDLASAPGGIAPDVKPPAGCHIVRALSLPGKVAPLSAARAIYATVLTILQEEGKL